MRLADSARRPSPVRSIVIGLLAGLFLARAMVPTGYMPDFDALAEGRIGIKICSAGLLRNPFDPPVQPGEHGHEHRDHHGHHDHHDHHGSDPLQTAPEKHSSGADHSDHYSKDPCPFGTAVAKAFVPPAPLAMPTAMASAADNVFRPESDAVAIRPTGPPLGSRAPPLNLV